LDVLFGHNVVDNDGGDFEPEHCLVRPLPETGTLSIGVGKVQFADQLTELSEQYSIEVAVVIADYVFLVIRVFLFGHCPTHILRISQNDRILPPSRKDTKNFLRFFRRGFLRQVQDEVTLIYTGLTRYFYGHEKAQVKGHQESRLSERKVSGD